jgi:hypothetical protein
MSQKNKEAFHETIHDYRDDLSFACGRGSSIAPCFSGANNGQHRCDTDVGERVRVPDHRRAGNLAVDGQRETPILTPDLEKLL